jgi:regulator of protease activity HflC (stomatin/prohibitin superfamily)
MVQVAGVKQAVGALKVLVRRSVILTLASVGGALLFYGACTARVGPNEFGVEQRKFGAHTGIVARTYGPGLYLVPVGTAMHTFPREIHVLEASYDRAEAKSKGGSSLATRIDAYFDRRSRLLGQATHRVIEAFNIQTSDGYSVAADVTLLYSIEDPVRIARDFGWGSLYVDAFVINGFRNGVLTTLGKMNAESFYDEAVRIRAIQEAEDLLRQRFAERGFKVERLLLRNYQYADSYEKSLETKKVAVQLAEKNRKESLVNEEKAKLKQIESKGNGTITIAASEVQTRIAKVRAEAELYSSQVRAKADKEVNVATAEAKRLKADALTQPGGRYVVALETARMFDNIDGAVMTPEQYIAFVRNAWALIGVSPGGAAPSAQSPRQAAGGRQ